MSRAFHFGRIGVCLAVIAGVVGFANPAVADLIANGSFATGTSGWSIYGTGDWNNGSETNPSPDGGSLWNSEGCWVLQKPSAALVAGQTYLLSFSAAIQSTTGVVTDADKTIYAHVTSDTAGHGDANGRLGHGAFLLSETWQSFNYLVSSTAGESAGAFGVAFLNNQSNQSYDGTFTGGAGYCRFAIDNVSLTAVPEPATLSLASLGILGLLAYAWRKRG